MPNSRRLSSQISRILQHCMFTVVVPVQRTACSSEEQRNILPFSLPFFILFFSRKHSSHKYGRKVHRCEPDNGSDGIVENPPRHVRKQYSWGRLPRIESEKKVKNGGLQRRMRPSLDETPAETAGKQGSRTKNNGHDRFAEQRPRLFRVTKSGNVSRNNARDHFAEKKTRLTTYHLYQPISILSTYIMPFVNPGISKHLLSCPSQDWMERLKHIHTRKTPTGSLLIDASSTYSCTVTRYPDAVDQGPLKNGGAAASDASWILFDFFLLEQHRRYKQQPYRV